MDQTTRSVRLGADQVHCSDCGDTNSTLGPAATDRGQPGGGRPRSGDRRSGFGRGTMSEERYRSTRRPESPTFAAPFRPGGGRMNVLIAEDEPISRKVTRALLRRHGHFAVALPDGQSAFEVLVNNPDFDLVITDVQMPHMTGLELIQALRRETRFDALPILVVSGVISVTQVAGLLELGADRFLAKPVDEKLLMREVASLERWRGGGSTHAGSTRAADSRAVG
ncbi:MAG: response regulator [Myxococcales bacterium FL481]|nr:MAG: response regulator [Myxococcales bacterium FL481]